jgi:hypothetical protein
MDEDIMFDDAGNVQQAPQQQQGAPLDGPHDPSRKMMCVSGYVQNMHYMMSDILNFASPEILSLFKIVQEVKDHISHLQPRTLSKYVPTSLSLADYRQQKTCGLASLPSVTILRRIIHISPKTLVSPLTSARCTRICQVCMHPVEEMVQKPSQLV